MRDFLQLQMALCMERTNRYDQASHLLGKILESDSPALKAVAYYHCCLLELQKKQFLNARTKAYQAIACIDAVDFDNNWTHALKQNCHFLAAEAVTKEVLALCNADNGLPENLWGNFSAADELFVKLDQEQLRTFLNSGSQQMKKAVLGPQIQPLNRNEKTVRYDVTADGTSIEELLTRFAADAKLDLRWHSEAGETAVRKRLVYLHLSAATNLQVVTAAAGCAGLAARIDDNGIINIFNPDRYSSASEHTAFLNEEAVLLWQKFLLTFLDDHRLANIHFALGLLHAANGRLTDALAEYKLLATHFPQSSLTPVALLNSSNLKNSLHDYLGGREDLRQLVEQYPDTEIIGKAYLCLADTTANANLTAEAARLYGKVYNLSFSPESQSTAALGAGKSFFQIKNYESAAKWLMQYIKLNKDRSDKDLYSVYFLYGKTCEAMGNTEQASDAFRCALQGGISRLTRQDYLETLSALAETYMQQGHYIKILDMLEDVQLVTLSQKESVEILLIKSRTLRAMGLFEKALAALGDKAEYLTDPQLKAEISFELAQCYIEKGDLNLAHKKLAETLAMAAPGPSMHKIALTLADVCSRLRLDSQTISVCSQLLDLQPSEQIKQKALELLAAAYKRQKNLDGAALALLGQWK